MLSCKNTRILFFLAILLFAASVQSHAETLYKFVVKEAWYKRLCNSKKILTVNGQFPGLTLYVNRGDTIYVDVYNRGNYNITIHWHGVIQPKNPWADGPEYITQCPIQPGAKFRQKVIFSDEEGTLWWHAHSDWSRATVHGAIVVYPKTGTTYPFPKPYVEVPIILGEWWKKDIMEVFQDFLATGGAPIVSEAFTINGQPGDLYPCSRNDTFQINVIYEKTYLLRIVNAVVNEIIFLAIANHKLIVVGTDGSYTKTLTADYIAISPGQTLDCLLHANQNPNQNYYMAARAYFSGVGVTFDNTTTTAIIKYDGYNSSSTIDPLLPYLPYYNDKAAAVNFTSSLRSLASQEYPIEVPTTIDKTLRTTLSINAFPCDNASCTGPNGNRLAASMNNITWVLPRLAILEAYDNNINHMYKKGAPNFPPFEFNYTADFLPLELDVSKRGTLVTILKYNATVEMVLQGTNLVVGIDHPMHLHGYNFFIVALGLGNFDENKDPKNYNLVDPPRPNTVAVPKNGWATIRFKANNPGVWFMHCHIERHASWGMDTVFIVEDEDENSPDKGLLPRPPDMPPC